MVTRTPVWFSQDYWFRFDDGTLSTASEIAPVNTAASIIRDRVFRLRLNVGESNNANSGNATAFKLQFRVNAGAWADVGAATAVSYAASAFVTDGTAASTQRLPNVAGSAFDGTYSEFDSNNTLASRTWADQYAEYEFALKINSASVAVGATVQFRAVLANGTVPAITNTATATAVSASVAAAQTLALPTTVAAGTVTSTGGGGGSEPGSGPPTLNSSGVLRGTTTDTVEINPGSRVTDYMLFAVVAFRCSTPGSASLSTPANWTKLVQTVQGSTIAALYTKKWATGEPTTSVTVTGGGTIDNGFANVVAYTATNATTRWWDGLAVAKGTHTGGANSSYTVTMPASTLQAFADVRMVGLVVTGDDVAAWGTVPTGWTHHNISGLANGTGQGRAHLHQQPASTSVASATGSLTATSNAPASLDWISFVVGASTAGVTESLPTITATAAQTLALPTSSADATVTEAGTIAAAAAHVLDLPASSAAVTVQPLPAGAGEYLTALDGSTLVYQSGETGAANLGTDFYVSERDNRDITGLRFWRDAAAVAADAGLTFTASLYDQSGALLAQGTRVGTAAGWNAIAFAAPVTPDEIVDPTPDLSAYTTVIENQTFTSTYALEGNATTPIANVLIRNCTFSNITGNGLDIRYANNVRVENCVFDTISGSGIRLRNSGSTDSITITNCLIQHVANNGISSAVQDDGSVLHTNTRIIGNRLLDTAQTVASGTYHGIYTQSPDVWIENNVLIGVTDGNGISHRSTGTIRGNYVEDTGEAGIAYYADHPPGPSGTLNILDNVVVNWEIDTELNYGVFLKPGAIEAYRAATFVVTGNRYLWDVDARTPEWYSQGPEYAAKSVTVGSNSPYARTDATVPRRYTAVLHAPNGRWSQLAGFFSTGHDSPNGGMFAPANDRVVSGLAGPNGTLLAGAVAKPIAGTGATYYGVEPLLGTVETGTETITGQASQTLALAASTATGASSVAAMAGQTVAAPASSATASSTITGSASHGLGLPASTAEAAARVVGSAAQTPSLPVSAAVGQSSVSGQLAHTLALPASSASGGVGSLPTVTATAGQSLVPPTSGAAADPRIAASLAHGLTEPVSSAVGGVSGDWGVTASAAQELPLAASAGAADAIVTAQAGHTLAPASQATASAPVEATVATLMALPASGAAVTIGQIGGVAASGSHVLALPVSSASAGSGIAAASTTVVALPDSSATVSVTAFTAVSATADQALVLPATTAAATVSALPTVTATAAQELQPPASTATASPGTVDGVTAAAAQDVAAPASTATADTAVEASAGQAVAAPMTVAVVTPFAPEIVTVTAIQPMALPVSVATGDIPRGEATAAQTLPLPANDNRAVVTVAADATQVLGLPVSLITEGVTTAVTAEILAAIVVRDTTLTGVVEPETALDAVVYPADVRKGIAA